MLCPALAEIDERERTRRKTGKRNDGQWRDVGNVGGRDRQDEEVFVLPVCNTFTDYVFVLHNRDCATRR